MTKIQKIVLVVGLIAFTLVIVDWTLKLQYIIEIPYVDVRGRGDVDRETMRSFTNQTNGLYAVLVVAATGIIALVTGIRK